MGSGWLGNVFLLLFAHSFSSSMNALKLELTRRSLASWPGGQYENISSQISNGICEEMGRVFLVDLRALLPRLDRADFRGLGSVSPRMRLFFMVVLAVTLRRFAGGKAVQSSGGMSPSSSRSANPSSTLWLFQTSLSSTMGRSAGSQYVNGQSGSTREVIMTLELRGGGKGGEGGVFALLMIKQK